MASRSGSRGRSGSREGRDRYALSKRPIGTGGFAVVFHAVDKQLDRPVALKRLRARDAEAKRRFEREIAVQRLISHRHVMPVLDVDPLGFWYTMPLAAGSLASLGSTLTVREAMRALREVGAGLAEGHARDLTHRDITPTNVLAFREADDTLRWVVADWGLVRLPDGRTTSFKTQSPVGTARFIAPELWHDPHGATARSDLYSLGIVAQYLCEVNCWGSEAGFDRFINACTAAERQQRPASVADALQLLGMKGAITSPTFLVWVRENGSTTTHLVRCNEDGALTVVGCKRGIFVCDGARLLEWKCSTHTILVPDFETLDREHWIATRHVAQPLEDVSLEDFDTGGSVRVSPVEPRDRVDNTTFDFVRSTSALGGAGHYLFVVEHLYTFGGGAHGNTVATFRVVDAHTGLPVEGMSPTEFARDFQPARLRAIEAYRASGRLDDGWLTDDRLADLPVTLYRPVIDGAGSAGIEVQVTFPCSYAGSDNLWSSYSESQRVQSDHVPHFAHGRHQPARSSGQMDRV